MYTTYQINEIKVKSFSIPRQGPANISSIIFDLCKENMIGIAIVNMFM